MKLSTFALLIAAAAAANAQLSGISGLSSGCTGTVTGFIFGDISNCLQVSRLLGVLGSSSSSVVTPLNEYLTALCADNTPICSNETLTTAATNVQRGCATDLEDQTSIASVLLTVLQHYEPIHTAACSKNESTSDFCVSSAITTVQEDTNSNVTFSTITGLLGGNQDAQGILSESFATGHLCTGCVAGIYNAAVAVNSSVVDSPIGQTVTGQCGANFANTTAGVSTPSTASPSDSAATSSAVAGTSGATARAGWLVGVGSVVAAALGAAAAVAL